MKRTGGQRLLAAALFALTMTSGCTCQRRDAEEAFARLQQAIGRLPVVKRPSQAPAPSVEAVAATTRTTGVPWLLTGPSFAPDASPGAPPALDDWPGVRGPNGDGVSNDTRFSMDRIEELWRADVGTGFSAIAVAGGRLYTMGNKGGKDRVVCLDPTTGRAVWVFEYACALAAHSYEGGPTATPAVHQGKVVTLAQDGQIHCLDARTGALLWSYHAATAGASAPGWGYSGSPAIAGDLVVFNCGDRGLALALADGRVAWQSGGPHAGYAPPVVYRLADGAERVALFTATALIGVDARTGRLLWQYEWRTPSSVNAAAPLFFDGKLFISSGYDMGCALLDVAGDQVKEVWRNRSLKNHFSSSVFYGGHIFGVDGNAARRAGLVCLESAGGRTVWRASIGFGTVLVVAGKLLVLDESGELSAGEASPKPFRALASRQLLTAKCWTPPTVTSGFLFARNAEGEVVCWASEPPPDER